jgi:uridine kinase
MNGLRIEVNGALGSGKSTIAALISEVLEDIGFNVVCEDLGCVNLRKEKKLGELTKALKKEHFRRIVSKLGLKQLRFPLRKILSGESL